MYHTAFSVRLTSLSWISLSPLLLSVCLALDFIQDQEPVKKGPWGGGGVGWGAGGLGRQRFVALVVSLIVGFFL